MAGADAPVRILFRADARPDLGGGHIMRCLSLAAALDRRGCEIAFACAPGSADLVPALSRSGFAWAEARQRVTYHATIGVGVLIASVTGIGAWLAGRPFLTSDYGYLHFPPIEEFEWATAMAFDTGVFLTVVGAVMLALNSLSSMARRAGETVNVTPMDINPALNDTPGEKEA